MVQGSSHPVFPPIPPFPVLVCNSFTLISSEFHFQKFRDLDKSMDSDPVRATVGTNKKSLGWSIEPQFDDVSCNDASDSLPHILRPSQKSRRKLMDWGGSNCMSAHSKPINHDRFESSFSLLTLLYSTQFILIIASRAT